MMSNIKFYKRRFEHCDIYFIGIPIYSRTYTNFKGINISIGHDNCGLDQTTAVYSPASPSTYPHFFNFEISGREVKEEISFRFSSTDLSESKFFVTSIPELSNIFFHRPNDNRLVTMVNTNKGTIDQITFDQFNRIRESNKMVNNVILKNIKNRKI